MTRSRRVPLLYARYHSASQTNQVKYCFGLREYAAVAAAAAADAAAADAGGL